MAKKVVPETLDQVLARLEVPLEEFARNVGMIADGMKVFQKSQLKMTTIIHLVSRSAGIGYGDTQKVIEALGSLDKKYLKP